VRWYGSTSRAVRGRGRCERRGGFGAQEGVHRRQWGKKAPGSGDVGRQVEGIGRLSIIPGPSSRAGRCGTFQGEKRKFLSVILACSLALYFTEVVRGDSSWRVLILAVVTVVPWTVSAVQCTQEWRAKPAPHILAMSLAFLTVILVSISTT